MLPDSIDDLARISLRLIAELSLPGEKADLRLESAALLRSAFEPALRRQRELEALRTEPVRVLKPAWRRADAVAADFIRSAKRALRPHLGDRWNPAWAEAGFERGTLAMPDSFAGRQKLLGTLKASLTAHPEWQCPEQFITAARASQVEEALLAARRSLACHPSRCQAAKEARDRACSQLRRRLRRAMALQRSPAGAKGTSPRKLRSSRPAAPLSVALAT